MAEGLATVVSRRIPPPPAVAWRGARTACDGDGGCGGRADAGRALREAGPEAAQARSDRDERTPRNGPRGRVRRGVRPTQPPGSRRSRTCATPGLPLREGTASAKTGSEMRGEERGGARRRMGSRAGGGEGGLHAAEPTSAARPPRPGFAERPRISERRALGARSLRAVAGAFHLRNGAKARFAGLRDGAAPKSGEGPAFFRAGARARRRERPRRAGRSPPRRAPSRRARRRRSGRRGSPRRPRARRRRTCTRR